MSLTDEQFTFHGEPDSVLDAQARPLCIGTAFDQKTILDAGGAYLPWQAEPSPADLRDVQRVFLAPTAAEAAVPKLPAFLAAIASLRTLAIPQTFVSALAQEVLPRSLACLQLTYQDLYLPRKGWPDLRWPTPLPQVRGIFQHAFGGPSNAWASLGLSPALLPNLEFISCDIDGAQKALELVAAFPKLRHAELEIVRHSRVFEVLPLAVQTMSLTAAFQKFSFKGIDRLSALRTLKINGARCEIDFELFLACPELVEVNILNSKKFKNLEALLRHPTLKSVHFLNCGNPFDLSMRDRFKSHGFDRIEIDFS